MHPRSLQARERLGRLAHHRAHDRLVAQPLAHDERVGEVQLDGVGLAHRAGDAALRVPRVRLGESRLVTSETVRVRDASSAAVSPAIPLPTTSTSHACWTQRAVSKPSR